MFAGADDADAVGADDLGLIARGLRVGIVGVQRGAGVAEPLVPAQQDNLTGDDV